MSGSLRFSLRIRLAVRATALPSVISFHTSVLHQNRNPSTCVCVVDEHGVFMFIHSLMFTWEEESDSAGWGFREIYKRDADGQTTQTQTPPLKWCDSNGTYAVGFNELQTSSQSWDYNSKLWVWLWCPLKLCSLSSYVQHKQ